MDFDWFLMDFWWIWFDPWGFCFIKTRPRNGRPMKHGYWTRERVHFPQQKGGFFILRWLWGWVMSPMGRQNFAAGSRRSWISWGPDPVDYSWHQSWGAWSCQFFLVNNMAQFFGWGQSFPVLFYAVCCWFWWHEQQKMIMEFIGQFAVHFQQRCAVPSASGPSSM